jgi:hypothetical protein
MKNLAVVLSSFIILPSALLHAGWVVQTAHELATQGDFDIAGEADLLVVDRASGTLRVGLVNGVGITWTEPAPTGAIDATSIAFGSFNYNYSTPKPALAVTAPMLNRVQLMFHANAEPQTASTMGVGPHTLLTLRGGPEAPDGILLVSSSLNNPPDPWRIAIQSLTAGGDQITDALLERGNEIDNDLHGFIARTPAAAVTDSFRLHQSGGLAEAWKTIVGITAGSDWATGQFTATSSQRQYLFWVTGQAGLYVRGFDQLSSPPAFDAGITHTLPQGIDQLTVLDDTTPPRLLIVFAGGTSAGVHDFDGVNSPVLAHSFTPEPGQTFRHALATSGGDFHLFSGAAGSFSSDTARRYRRQPDGSYLADAPSSMSPLRGGNRRTNLLLYQGEPFVNEEAHIVSALSARDWTSAPSGVPGMIQTTAETFQSSLSGLGQGQSISLGASTQFASHALPNQIAQDVSVIVYSPSIGMANPAFEYSPPPGRYRNGLGVRIVPTSTYGINQIYYRTSTSAAWQSWNPHFSAPIEVTEDTVLQAYLDRYGQRTPVITANYTLGSSPAAPMTGTDANNNGLGDEWEDYFDLHDPNADSDGDGYTNKQEHDAQTDPGDPASHPNPAPGQPYLLITSVSPSTGVVGLRLYGTAGQLHRIEWSPSLESTSWQTLGSDFAMPTEGFIDQQDTGVSDTRRFYRAKAL